MALPEVPMDPICASVEGKKRYTCSLAPKNEGGQCSEGVSRATVVTTTPKLAISRRMQPDSICDVCMHKLFVTLLRWAWNIYRMINGVAHTLFKIMYHQCWDDNLAIYNYAGVSTLHTMIHGVDIKSPTINLGFLYHANKGDVCNLFPAYTTHN